MSISTSRRRFISAAVALPAVARLGIYNSQFHEIREALECFKKVRLINQKSDNHQTELNVAWDRFARLVADTGHNGVIIDDLLYMTYGREAKRYAGQDIEDDFSVSIGSFKEILNLDA